MSAIKSFIKTTLLGGMLVVLPLVILILVFTWLFEFIVDKIRPITDIILETTKMQEFAASGLALLLIILCFFLVGLVVQTKIGKFLFEYFEKSFFSKIPLYNIIKETTIQLVSSNKTLFKHVALVKLYGNDTRLTAFVTEIHTDGSYTVFVPSGPAPTAGFIYHLKKESVELVNYPVERAMKTIFSFGAGSKELLNRTISN
ncbi:MAG: DUF502 domain-containing protein [Melioribacteraceae bacterium]|nr:DUF502 domain-containing protein [Melioribacteraceae bacterium]